MFIEGGPLLHMYLPSTTGCVLYSTLTIVSSITVINLEQNTGGGKGEDMEGVRKSRGKRERGEMINWLIVTEHVSAQKQMHAQLNM